MDPKDGDNTARFSLVKAPDGTWRVIDGLSGKTAVFQNVTLEGMRRRDAELQIELLNHIAHFDPPDPSGGGTGEP